MLNFILYKISLLISNQYSYIFTPFDMFDKLELDVIQNEVPEMNTFFIKKENIIASTNDYLKIRLENDFTNFQNLESLKNNNLNSLNRIKMFELQNLNNFILLLNVQKSWDLQQTINSLTPNYLLIILFIKDDYYFNLNELMKNFLGRRIILGCSDLKLFENLKKHLEIKNEKKFKKNFENSYELFSDQKDSKIKKNEKEIINELFSEEQKDLNDKEIIKIICYQHIHRIFALIFYLLCFILAIVCFLTIQTWLKSQKTQNPLITPTELQKCKIILFKEMNDPIFCECLICMESFYDNDKLRILKCGHFYHLKCIDPWLKQQCSRCPYCRELIKEED